MCSLAIARYAHVHLSDADAAVQSSDDSALADAAIRRAGLTGVHASITSDFPVSAGLGGSSAAGVAMAAAIQLWRHGVLGDRSGLAEESRATEVEELEIAGGRQDHYAAALGGALDLRFGAETLATHIPVSHALKNKLEAQCVLVYTGESRISGITIAAVLDGYLKREGEVTSRLHDMKELAGEMIVALHSEDVNALGMLVDAHWTLQRGLHSGISTPVIESTIKAGKRAGAIGAKALGASGGGCVVLIAEPGAGEAVSRAVSALTTPLAFTIDAEGVTVTEHMENV